jgi:hypothetical protein
MPKILCALDLENSLLNRVVLALGQALANEGYFVGLCVDKLKHC